MFPLFRLPMLAVQEIFRSMETAGLFYISLISNRAKQAIRASVRKSSVRVFLNFRPTHIVDMGSFRLDIARVKMERPLFGAEPCKVGNQEIRLTPFVRQCLLEPEKSFEGYSFKIIIIHHLVEALRLDISISCTNVNFAIEFIRYFKEKKTEISKVEIRSLLTTTEYTEILNGCSDIEELNIIHSPPIPFQYDFSEPFTTKSLTVTGYWMTLEDFMQCERLRIIDNLCTSPRLTRWTPERLNAFFKAWIVTDCKLEYFDVDFDENFYRVVEGLSYRPTQDERAIEVQKKDGRQFKIFHEKDFLKLEPII